MPSYEIDDQLWNNLIQHIAVRFDDLTVKRGFQYYKQGRVTELTCVPHESLECIVEGNERYQVSISLGDLSLSECNCPVQGSCKHMIATLLQYAEMAGRNYHALVNAKSNAALQNASRTPSPGKIHQRSHALTPELHNLAQQIPELSVERWHDLFNLCSQTVQHQSIYKHYVENILEAISQLKPRLEPAIDVLYQLHAQLYAFKLLTAPAGASNSPSDHVNFLGYYTSMAISERQEAIEKLLLHVEELTVEPGTHLWTLVMETLDYLRTAMLSGSPNHQDYLNYYLQFWISWICPNLRDTAVIRQELEYLTLAESSMPASSTASSKSQWKTFYQAKCWISYLLADDEQAVPWMKEAHENSRHFFFFILNLLYLIRKDQNWLRLELWLTEAGPLLESRHQDVLNSYADCWRDLVSASPSLLPKMWDTLREMLPFSHYVYERLLLEYSEWHLWMDYQLANRSEPLNYRATDLKPMEKEAPEVLLPFYHQAVERYVLEKNRDSYKKAVKLLKRLDKLYAKTKRTDRWEQFLESFTGKHNRLRALQEEMRKGRLIP